MAVSSLFTVVDALVALFGADGQVINLTGLDYTVYDGEPAAEDYPQNVLIFGWDGDPEGEFKLADLNQDWADAQGSRRRNEQIEIICCVICNYGDGGSWKPSRDRAKTVLTDVETKLRAAPDLNIPIDGTRQFLIAEYKPIGAFQEPTGQGYQFRIPFVVRVQTRV